MKVEAPAKLNLSLRIAEKRPDGFHELDTLMVPLPGLTDELDVEGAEEFSFSCDDPAVPSDESNLVVQAVRLFEQRTGRTCRYAIRLAKRIPSGAGLGGGSSDAAAILAVMEILEDTGLGRDDLHELAARLGSDVPFFLRQGACRCRGRGEVLEDASVEAFPVLLLKPGFGVSTPDAYGRWRESRQLAGVRYDPQGLDGMDLVNDLERPVFEKFPFLAEMKTWLLAQPGVRAALMSGSGATVFAVLADDGDGEALAEAARRDLDPGLWSWTGETGGAR
ncbi:MAG: 4-(cytidine 5'-diphospho)-2-C-methyl-D-erythritol kinase [Akkermansiaceae bacterium]|nr:4-(cytidine 5'-diphospho)-2-C-methyl-D-erythritol kinase [Akkermansiaceae bacterium]NNM30407.1 4-(cytidine 5'-diphospho)-2-C-methyl-D-erythritol kinase [Akkermansiaceae bacterium]